MIRIIIMCLSLFACFFLGFATAATLMVNKFMAGDIEFNVSGDRIVSSVETEWEMEDLIKRKWILLRVKTDDKVKTVVHEYVLYKENENGN